MFSIVIPTYKRDEDLEECLDSIRKNTKMSVEIIVLHGGFESTEKICKKYDAISMLDNARKDGKRVKGLWAIINEGIKAAKYDYVMYLNDDCLVLPDWDKNAAKYFENEEKLGLLVLKSKGIGQNPEFRIAEGGYGFPCANYAIINKKMGLLFDEKYDWFYGDADLPLEIAYKTDYKIKTTEENMVIHNHKIDENRKEHEDGKDVYDPDFMFYEKKWMFFKRKGDRLVKKSFVRKLLYIIKTKIKG